MPSLLLADARLAPVATAVDLMVAGLDRRR